LSAYFILIELAFIKVTAETNKVNSVGTECMRGTTLLVFHISKKGGNIIHGKKTLEEI
jgi:hypothetical protein